jgi:hypothetical protein
VLFFSVGDRAAIDWLGGDAVGARVGESVGFDVLGIVLEVADRVGRTTLTRLFLEQPQ